MFLSPTQLIKAIEDYNITAENIYNWDEKGFLIRIIYIIKHIITKEVYDSRKITKAKQDGLREFISLLASIYTDGIKILPALIYKGTSGDLQNTWLDDLKEREYAWFTSSVNG